MSPCRPDKLVNNHVFFIGFVQRGINNSAFSLTQWNSRLAEFNCFAPCRTKLKGATVHSVLKVHQSDNFLQESSTAVPPPLSRSGCLMLNKKTQHSEGAPLAAEKKRRKKKKTPSLLAWRATDYFSADLSKTRGGVCTDLTHTNVPVQFGKELRSVSPLFK